MSSTALAGTTPSGSTATRATAASTTSVGSDLAVVTLFRQSLCGCGEVLARGERAGQRPGSRAVFCLACLHDVRAGLMHLPAVAAVTAVSPTVDLSELADAAAPEPGPWFALLVPVAAALAVVATQWPLPGLG